MTAITAVGARRNRSRRIDRSDTCDPVRALSWSSEPARQPWAELATLLSLLASLTRHIPPGQLGRYVLVGLWNAVFCYGSFALFTALLDRYMPASYMPASLLATVLNITVSFLGYKWFVFKTKGNYLKEWARCLMVYSAGIVLNLAMLPPTVFLVSRLTRNPRAAPYIAGVLLLGVQAAFSFLGHKGFSFKIAPLDKSAISTSQKG